MFPTPEMQIAGGAILIDDTGIETKPGTVGWLTATRVYLAMQAAAPKPEAIPDQLDMKITFPKIPK